MNWNRRVLCGLAASVAIPATAGMATLWNCYELRDWTCCADSSIKCSWSDGGVPPLISNWWCLQDSNAVGFTTLAAVQVPVGQHLTMNTIPVGSCTITPSTCGATPNACNVGTPFLQDCADAVLTGSCTTP